MFNNQLEFAAPFVKADTHTCCDKITSGRFEFNQLVATAKHGTPHLRVFILERKVPVTGRGLTEVGNFTFHPNEWQMDFEEFLCSAIEVADAENFSFGVGAICLHGNILTHCQQAI